MKKRIYYSIVYFIIHAVFSLTISPFLVGFGSGEWIGAIVRIFTEFPVRYSDSMNSSWFLLHYLVNAIFWALVFFTSHYSYHSVVMKKRTRG